MARAKTIHTCTECGGQAPKWQGQCPHCSAWNTLVETALEMSVVKGVNRFASLAGASEVVALAEVEAEDFPRLPDVDAAPTSTVDADALLGTLSSVGRAVSRDEARPVLTGVLMKFAEGKLVMAATDSYRLAYKETPIDGTVPDLEAIVPGRALEELRRLAPTGGTLELGVQENQVLFGIGGTWLTTRRIEGQFPKFEELRPKEFAHEVTVPREELLDVVRRTAVMAHRNAPLRLRFAEGELTVWTQTQDVGEARETLPVRFEGEPLEIGFNADFLRDGIESAEGDELRVRLIDPLRPGLLQGRGEDFWYLIMPIRLAG